MSTLGLVGFLGMVVGVSAVGARLLWIGRHTRQVPEIAIGTACVTSTLGGLGILASTRLPAGSASAFAISAVAQFLLNTGAVALSLGVWRVFRPASSWAPLACAALGLALLAAWIVALLPGRAVQLADSSSPSLALYFGRITIYAWAAIECFHYHRKLRRRLALGLGEPVVASQILLWGVSASATAIIMAVATYCGSVLGVSSMAWPPALVATSALGLISGVALWCAFFPPASYRHFVEARAAGVRG